MTEATPDTDSKMADRTTKAMPGSGVAVAALASAGNVLADVLVIDRPAPGQMKIVETAAAQLLKFSFDLYSCKITVLDVDAILVFPDGGKIVMPNFALQMVVASPPVMQFDAVTVEPHVLLARAGDIKLLDQIPEFALSDTARPDAKAETPQPTAQIVQVTATQQYGHTPGPQSRPFVIDGTGVGLSLSETNGRFAKRVDTDESQGSSLKGEGALTENSQQAATTDTNTNTTTDVNNAEPEFTSPPDFSHTENTALITTLTATDADQGSILTFAVVGGADADKFSVNSATGRLYFIGNPDFEALASHDGSNTYQVIVAVSDGIDSTTQELTITLDNINEAPDGIAISAVGVDESTATGTVVGTVTGHDPDAGSLLTYSFAPGGDAGGRFTIDGSTGIVSVLRGDLIDFEASQSQLIVVRTTDQDGLSFDRAIVISVNDTNDAPVITSNGGGSSAAISISENVTSLTTVTATDADAGSVVSYAIVGGTDAGRFVIDSTTGTLSFITAIDFEVPGDANGDNIYNVVVQASDGRGGTDQQALAIAVVNANDPPEDLVLSANIVAENSVNGSLIGFVHATDPDVNSVLTYSFVSGGDAGGRFAIDAVSGEISVLDGTRLDFESNPTQTIIIRATDQGGLSTDRAFVIQLTDVNEAPSIISDGGGATAAFSVSEGSPLATRVSAFDPEGAPLTYSITGGADASRFTINSTTGVVTFIATPNFELPGDADADNIYRLTVQVSDGTFTDSQALSITVTDTSEAPVITSNGGGDFTAVALLEGATFVTTVTATDPDAGSTLNYSIIGGADASRFTINALTGALSLVAPPDFESPADADFNNIYDVVVQVSDGSLTDAQAIQVTVINQNDAPVIVSDGGNATAAVSAVENSAFVTTVSAVDPDIGSVLIYTISGGVDASRFTINASTGALMFIAVPDFEAPVDIGSDNVYDVQVQVLDGVGGVDTQSISVTVTNQNEAPVIVSNGGGPTAALSIQENQTGIATLAATDPDAGAVLTYSIFGGADAAKFTINAITGVLTFTAAPDFDIAGDVGGNNVYDVVVQVSDGLGGIDQQAIAVTVTNQNEAPVITSNGGGATAALSVQENAAVVTTVTASDPDAATTLTYTIVGGADAGRFNINPTTGVLTFIAPPDFEVPGDVGGDGVYDVTVQVADGNGGLDTQAIAVTVTNQNEAPVIVSNGGGATAAVAVLENATAVSVVAATDPDAGAVLTYSIFGGADAAKFTINAGTGALTFVSGPDFDIPGDAGGNNVYDVIVQVSDGLGGMDQQVIAVTVLNVNEAPSITSNGGGAIAALSFQENAAVVTTVMATDPDAATTLTYTIVGGADAGRFNINPTTGVLTFVTPPDFEVPSDVGGDGVYDVTVQVADGNGGLDTQAIAVTVTNQNEAPVIVSNGGGATAAVAVLENATAVSVVAATDPDAGAVLAYSIFGGADAAKFTINAATGVLTFVSAPDFESPADVGGNNIYDVIVQVSDGLGGVDTQAIAVSVTNQNETPSITSNGGGATAGVTVQENGTAVTTVTASDPDAATTLIYTIIGGADSAKFTINPANGVLTFLTGPDFEAPSDVGSNNIYDVTVQVSDGLGGTDTQAIAVTVVNQNEAPVITSNGGGATAAVSVAENSTAVTTVTATDVDAGATRTYSIIGGADAALFTVNASTGVLAFLSGRNFEAPTDVGANNIYDVTVQVSDSLGGIDTQAIAVTITNVNEAPVISSNGGGATASISRAENGTSVTTVTSVDPDAGATKTFSIIGGVDAAKFTINAATGVLTFLTAPNFEAPTDSGLNNIYDVTVQVSDSLGGIDTQAIAVTITNANEPPDITSNGGLATAAISMSENGTAVTTVAATDPDAAAVLTYSISGGADAAKFTINAATGVLTFIAAPDFETPTDVGANNVYDVTVQVSDGLGGIDTQAIAVTITNQNEAPVITSNGGAATAAVSIAENGTSVTTVTSTDPDAGATKTFSIIGGVDAAKFTINAATGVLTFLTAPNFEAPTDSGLNNIYDVTVQVSDSLGGIDTQAIAITITNANEPPDITSNGGLATAAISMSENGTAVTTVAATDPDAGAVLTYSISGGADAAKFAINASTGVLTFIAAPDFDIAGDAGANNVYDVTVQVSDGLGGTDMQAIAVTITNVNEAPVITSNGGGATASISRAESGTSVTTVTSTDPDAGATTTFSIIGGADAAQFTINAATGVLTFVTAPDFEVPADSGLNNIYDVIVQVSDGLGGIDTQAIAVTITNANEAPNITSNGGAATAAISMSENATTVTTVAAADPDVGAVLTYSIAGGADAAKFAINASTGVLTFIAAPDFEAPADAGANNVYDVTVQVSDGLGGTDTQTIAVTITDLNDTPPTIISNGGGATAAVSVAENTTAVTTVLASDPDVTGVVTYSIVGGADAAKFSINATTGVLNFISSQDFETPSDIGANNIYDVVVRASDGDNSDDQSIAVTVTNQNEAPDVTSNGGASTAAITMAENGAAVTTVTATDPDAGAVLTYSIAGGADAAKFAINGTTGLLTFIAAPDFETNTDNGSDGVYDVTVQVSDGLGGTDTQAIAVTIADVNEAPIITSNGGGAAAAVSIAENTTTVTTVTTSDPDAGAIASFSIIGGADAALFTINATTGLLSFIAGRDFESATDADSNGIYEVIVEVSDGLGGTDTQAISVSLTDVNEAPVIKSNGGGGSASISLAENNLAVTDVAATDVDAGATLTYAITGGADAALFTINATTGALAFITAPDFDIPDDAGGNNIYDVIVQVSDGVLTDTQSIAVTITNVNDLAPVITSDGGGATASVLIGENGSSVTTVTATDADLIGAITYSITGGADAVRFSINATTGVLTFVAAPDFEAPTDAGGNNIYDVVVQASDGSLTDAQSIAVQVGDVNETPVITSDGGAATADVSILENSTAVTTVIAADPDTGAILTYALVGGADQAKFTINAATGVLSFVAAPDFDSPGDANGDNVYVVTVQVSDGALTDNQTISVTVLNVNEAPVITSDGGAATASLSILENASAVTTVAATDPDSGAILTYALVGGADQAKFTINTATGVLSFVAAPDFDLPVDADANNVYVVTVQVSDGALTDNQTISVTVLNVNEAPIIASDGGAATASLSITENATAVTTVIAADPDIGSSLGYSLVGGADQAKFTINATTGVLSFIAAPDFDIPGDANGDNVYVVTVQVSDGALTDTQTISVTVLNVNEAPVITSDGGAATATVLVDENTTAVTTIISTDPDAGPVLTYSISGGTDQAAFSVDAATGILAFVAAPDFEAPTDTGADNIYDVQVTVSDGTLTDVQDIAVHVNDVLYFYFGSNFPELINGTVEGDGLYGNGGNDTIFGQQANDTIDGGAGNDIIDGGTGDDSIVGGNGSDTLVGGNGADFILGNDGNDVLLGDDDSDTLTGGTGDDYLSGDNGSDVLLGGGGVDTIDGGEGNDTLDGSGSNIIGLLGGNDNDLLMLDTAALEQAGTMASGGAGNDIVLLRDNGSSNPVLEVGLDIVGKVSGIEQIDATGANVKVDFSNSTAADIRSILGLSGPTGSGTLTLALDGNDSFSVASGEFVTQAFNLTTFYSDAGLTNEIARVSVI
jgi:hypothetical protein